MTYNMIEHNVCMYIYIYIHMCEGPDAERGDGRAATADGSNHKQYIPNAVYIYIYRERERCAYIYIYMFSIIILIIIS